MCVSTLIIILFSINAEKLHCGTGPARKSDKMICHKSTEEEEEEEENREREKTVFLSSSLSSSFLNKKKTNDNNHTFVIVCV